MRQAAVSAFSSAKVAAPTTHDWWQRNESMQSCKDSTAGSSTQSASSTLGDADVDVFQLSPLANALPRSDSALPSACEESSTEPPSSSPVALARSVSDVSLQHERKASSMAQQTLPEEKNRLPTSFVLLSSSPRTRKRCFPHFSSSWGTGCDSISASSSSSSLSVNQQEEEETDFPSCWWPGDHRGATVGNGQQEDSQTEEEDHGRVSPSSSSLPSSLESPPYPPMAVSPLPHLLSSTPSLPTFAVAGRRRSGSDNYDGGSSMSPLLSGSSSQPRSSNNNKNNKRPCLSFARSTRRNCSGGLLRASLKFEDLQSLL